MVKLSADKVTSWRLSKHHLNQRAPRSQLARVVSDVCGMQAQVMSAAQLGIWARVDDVTVQELEDALWKYRLLVKTWCMRGTLHLLSAQDLPLYVAGLKTRLGYRSRPWLKFHKITLGEIESITAEARAALDGHRLTREELVKDIVRRAGLRSWVKREMLSGWGSLLHPAAYQGNLCFGPNQGKNVTFVRPDQWLGEWNEPGSEEAMKTLARRFIAAYGPCSHEDFQHWWGIVGTGASPASNARKLFSSISDELVEVEFGKRKTWLREADLEEVENSAPSGSINLLPSFDCYVMLYHPRELLVERRFRERVFRQLAGWVSPVLLIDGLAGGTWQMKKLAKGNQVIVEPFRPLSSSQKQLLGEETKRLEEFLGAKTELGFGK